MEATRNSTRLAPVIGSMITTGPLIIAVSGDHFLSSCFHLPIIGFTSVAVALCDALFGQIISQTQWMPFAAEHTPAEARELVDRFEAFHRRAFLQWVGTKATSGFAIVLSAVLALSGKENLSPGYIGLLTAIGYLLMGFALRGVVFFLSTYFSARKAANEAKLNEIKKKYEKANEGLYSRGLSPCFSVDECGECRKQRVPLKTGPVRK